MDPPPSTIHTWTSSCQLVWKDVNLLDCVRLHPSQRCMSAPSWQPSRSLTPDVLCTMLPLVICLSTTALLLITILDSPSHMHTQGLKTSRGLFWSQEEDLFFGRETSAGTICRFLYVPQTIHWSALSGDHSCSSLWLLCLVWGTQDFRDKS